MKTQLGNAFLILVSALALSACQTTVSQNQTTQTINAPVAKVILDSDGDGVLDAIDECLETPLNVVADKRGCPVSVSAPMGHSYGGSYLFPINSSQLDISSYEANLKTFAKVIMPDCVVRLSGHISRYENTARNKTLASDRVEFVKNYLVTQYNVNPEQIMTAHYGDQRPITPPDASYEDSKLDQRVDADMTFDDSCPKTADS